MVKTLLSNFPHARKACHLLTERKYNVSPPLPCRVELSRAEGRSSHPTVGDGMGNARRYDSIAPMKNSLTGYNGAFDFASLFSSERIRSHNLSSHSITKCSIHGDVHSIVNNCPDTRRIIIEDLIDPTSQISPVQLSPLLYKLKSPTRNNPQVSILVTLSSAQLDESTLEVIRRISDCLMAMNDRPNVNKLVYSHQIRIIRIARSM